MKEINCGSSTKIIINKIKNDLKSNALGFLLCACSVGIMELIFGMVCPMRIVTGLPCPGCGLTRAFTALLKGDIAGSLKMHPLLLPLMTGTFWYLCQRYSPSKKRKAIHLYWLLCITAVFIVYVMRMVYLYPYAPPMLYESKNILHTFREILGMYGI